MLEIRHLKYEWVQKMAGRSHFPEARNLKAAGLNPAPATNFRKSAGNGGIFHAHRSDRPER